MVPDQDLTLGSAEKLHIRVDFAISHFSEEGILTATETAIYKTISILSVLNTLFIFLLGENILKNKSTLNTFDGKIQRK